MAAPAASLLAIPTSIFFHNPITYPSFNCLSSQIPVKSFCLKSRNPYFSVSTSRFSGQVKFRRPSQGAIAAMQQELELGNTITTNNDTVLLVGVTGGTGSSVLSGLLASGVPSSKLCVLTRNPTGDAARNLASRGVRLVAGDLDDASTVDKALEGIRAIYCHATSKDAAKADPAGEVRAKILAKAATAAGVEHIVYNSSGGGGHGITQVEQKHNIEKIFKNSGIPTTNLQAAMFMEEFWKIYTRPQILKGSFPFSMPGNKPLQLLSVKDMGLAAGIALKQPEKYGGVSLELAGDELTPLQMCEMYSKAQGSKVSHFRPPRLLFWFLNRDLYRIATFLSEDGYKADITDCRQRFPGLLTFHKFLELSHWTDVNRTYADGFDY